MRNPYGMYAYRKCKCIRCNNEDVIEWSTAVPDGLIIEPHEPCGTCGEVSAYIGPEIDARKNPDLRTFFNREDVLIH
jgi:hypothetical protein